MALAILLTAALGLASYWGPARLASADASVWYVDRQAAGANNGTSWEDAFVDLQAALTVAGSGDEIWVAKGTYYPSVEHGGSGDRFKSFQMAKGVGIYGGFDPSVGDIGWDDRDWISNKVTLSGDIGEPGNDSDNSYHVFYHPAELGLDSTAVLDGFTITEGNADEPEGSASDGGGMMNLNASPTVANCAIELNKAYNNGAGMLNKGASPHVSNCTFRLNRAGWDGGGMFNDESSPSVQDTVFLDNSALGSGGGVANQDSSASFERCAFRQNQASYEGGGMVNRGGTVALADSLFIGNTALEFWGEGGGISNSGSSVFLTNCALALNEAIKGGGMRTWGGTPRITNCTFYGNVAAEGGALSNASNASPVIANSVLWADTPDEISGGSPIVWYSDIQGGWYGEGNIAEDPQLVNPGNEDYHLAEGSPCIDAGTNDALYLPDYDFEGEDRVMDGDGDDVFLVDMGVDERLGTTLVPITGLEASNDSPTLLGSTTTLTATIATGNGVSYLWYPGDNTVANGKVVTHIYGAVGTYTAVVSATNFVSGQTAETTVTVVDAPIDGLEASNNSPTALGLATTLTATVTAGSNVDYTWDLGDGETATGAVVTHVYPQISAYTAVVTATNPVDQQTAITVVNIVSPAHPVFLPLVLRNR